ncbi:MAG: PIG-L family deacetylase [Chlorobi bacterium]|nr:PIG-L family deacetylase [Chlorobiota bacterium]
MSVPRILSVLAHPDDESFLMGGTIARYTRSREAEWYLLTLTQGEASRHRKRLNLSKEELAARRAEELETAAAHLGIREVFLRSYPDGGLRDLDPRVLLEEVRALVRRLSPAVLVTFDVQGGSLHPDHIVAHHVTKHVFCEQRERIPALRRLAFAGLPEETVQRFPRHLAGIPFHRIHARIPVAEYREYEQKAILAHESVQPDVEEYNYENWMLGKFEYYSFFQEQPDAVVDDLLAML